jgi:hypothetical protein
MKHDIAPSQSEQQCAHSSALRKERPVSLAAIGSRTTLVAERSACRAAHVPSHPAVLNVASAQQRFHKNFLFQTRVAVVGLALGRHASKLLPK